MRGGSRGHRALSWAPGWTSFRLKQRLWAGCLRHCCTSRGQLPSGQGQCPATPGASQGFSPLPSCPWHCRGLGQTLPRQPLAPNSFGGPGNGPHCPVLPEVPLAKWAQTPSALCFPHYFLVRETKDTGDRKKRSSRRRERRRKHIPETCTPNSKIF